VTFPEEAMENLLIAADDSRFVDGVGSKLNNHCKINVVKSGREAIEILKGGGISLVLLNWVLPDFCGSDVLKVIHREIDPRLPVIVRVEDATGENAIEAMRQGATDVVFGSFSSELLCSRIKKAFERRDLEVRMATLQNAFLEQHNRFVFASDVMKEVSFEITRLAALDFDVLLIGETGVGKDLIAAQLHMRGKRSDKPFIPISMKSLSESLIESELFGHEKGAFSGADRTRFGKLEAANGGTVYVPEISSLTEAVQLKLLHFMQYKTISRVGQDARTPEKKIDVRIILATNEPPEEQLKKGKIREDFYHRISGITLFVPPLRQRIGGIEPLANYFLKQFRQVAGCGDREFAPEVIVAFKAYSWSGNVRELENRIKKAVAYSKDRILTLRDFPDFPHNGEVIPPCVRCGNCLATHYEVLPKYKTVEHEFKRAYFEEVLRRAGNRISRAASISGMTRQGLKKIMDTLKMVN
jgi:DNA-binding NtrC family response regulator